MKYLVQTAIAAALIGLSSNVYAAVSGINYDPAYNLDWINAQKDNDVDKMTKLFIQDLALIRAMGFDTIKTYYSTYCAKSGECIQEVAELAQQAGLKVMLGVREFSTHIYEGCDSEDKCKQWAAVQVQRAIDQ